MIPFTVNRLWDFIHPCQVTKNAVAILICIIELECSDWKPTYLKFQVEPPPPPPTEPAKEEGMETEKGSESKTSEETPQQQKQAEMDVD